MQVLLILIGVIAILQFIVLLLRLAALKRRMKNEKISNLQKSN